MRLSEKQANVATRIGVRSAMKPYEKQAPADIDIVGWAGNGAIVHLL
jgi:hypothetical protein